MKYSFLLSYVLLFIVSLQLTDPTIDVIYANGNNYELILVAEENEAATKPFMAALLEYRDTESHSFEFTREKMTAQEVARSPKDIPSIIIKENGKVLGEISGSTMNKQQIIEELDAILYK